MTDRYENFSPFAEGDWTLEQKCEFVRSASIEILDGHDHEYKHFSPFDEKAWTQEQREFVKSVDMAMWGSDSIELENDGNFHALYLIYKFFVCAEKEMRIFSGELRCCASEGSPNADMKIYEDEHIIDAVEAFLSDKGTSLKIVVEREPFGGIELHPLVQRLTELSKANALRGNCKIVQFDKAKSGSDESLPLDHMVIMDRTACRLETDDSRARAVVSFNDEAKAKGMIGAFNSLWRASVHLWDSSAAK